MGAPSYEEGKREQKGSSPARGELILLNRATLVGGIFLRWEQSTRDAQLFDKGGEVGDHAH